jgi:hypothetical protein
MRGQGKESKVWELEWGRGRSEARGKRKGQGGYGVGPGENILSGRKESGMEKRVRLGKRAGQTT